MTVGRIESKPRLEDLQLISAEDVTIVVMGTTGAGKSSFVAQSTQDRTPKIGHDLASCTTRVSVHTTQMHGRTVHLIDTPGFDDTLRSDRETLQEFAYWLIAASEHGFRLSGVVFLHRITDTRFHGSAQRSLELFKAICGEDAFCGAVVATTMWDQIATGEMEAALSRQSQLRKKIQEDMISCGAKILPLSAGGIDARKVIRHIIEKDMRLTLALQVEIVDRGCSLQETGAGKILCGDILRSFESVGASIENCKREGTAVLESLNATCDELRTMWEERIKEEDESFKQVEREYKDSLQLCSRSDGISAPIQPGGTADKKLETENQPPSLSSTISLASYADLESELADLRRQYEGTLARQCHKLDRRRYLVHGRGTTTFGVVGTGLAVGQLVAAMACNVM